MSGCITGLTGQRRITYARMYVRRRMRVCKVFGVLASYAPTVVAYRVAQYFDRCLVVRCLVVL